MYCYAVFTVIALALGLYTVCTKKTHEIFGIYVLSNRFYYLKYFIILLFLKFRKFQSKRNKNVQSKQPGYGVRSYKSAADMDCIQTLPDDQKAVDAMYMNAANKVGWHLVAGVARGHHGIVNSLFYLKVPGIGLLQAPRLPDTYYVLSKDKIGTFSSDGLTFTPVQPMTVWKIRYQGLMKLAQDTKQRFHVKLEATFKSKFKIFDFDVDMKDECVARAMSLGSWNKIYFQQLKEFHQTHYEQHGELSGSVSIDGVDFDILLSCMRDHSYGKRDWTIFHRYILHIFTLEDGTRGNIGIISIPLMFSRLEIGYIYLKDGTLLPLEAIDLDIWQHGEGGTPPVDYAFTFKAGGETFVMKVEVTDSAEFYLGNEWEARIVERPCRFTVNGVDGWGATEWQYKNLSGRPLKYKQSDSTASALTKQY